MDAQATEVTCAPLKHRPVLPVIADHTHELSAFKVVNGDILISLVGTFGQVAGLTGFTEPEARRHAVACI